MHCALIRRHVMRDSKEGLADARSPLVSAFGKSDHPPHQEECNERIVHLRVAFFQEYGFREDVGLSRVGIQDFTQNPDEGLQKAG